MSFDVSMLSAAPLLAQAAAPVQGTSSSGPSPSLQWGIVLFMTILGLLVTLTPPRRTYEVKKPKEE